MKTMEIKGMSCMHCVNSVKKALSGVAGVTDVDVSLEKAMATITESGADAAALKAAVEKAGYEVVGLK